MKAALLGLGLAALVAGCAVNTNTDASKVGEEIVLTKPAGCETLKDIRNEVGSGDNMGYGYHAFQVLCEQGDGLVLYARHKSSNEWTSIKVR